MLQSATLTYKKTELLVKENQNPFAILVPQQPYCSKIDVPCKIRRPNFVHYTQNDTHQCVCIGGAKIPKKTKNKKPKTKFMY